MAATNQYGLTEGGQLLLRLPWFEDEPAQVIQYSRQYHPEEGGGPIADQLRRLADNLGARYPYRDGVPVAWTFDAEPNQSLQMIGWPHEGEYIIKWNLVANYSRNTIDVSFATPICVRRAQAPNLNGYIPYLKGGYSPYYAADPFRLTYSNNPYDDAYRPVYDDAYRQVIQPVIASTGRMMVPFSEIGVLDRAGYQNVGRAVECDEDGMVEIEVFRNNTYRWTGTYRINE